MITLKGMTWRHDRGLSPMIATAKQFNHSHPEVRIDWEARPLQGFADTPVDQLAEVYDLIVLDHPFIGTMASSGSFLPLDDYVETRVLQTLAANSVGVSHRSYNYHDRQWAVAIDAAAQVSAYRPDLLEKVGAKVPETWDEVFELAATRSGFVTLPLLPVDALMSFFSICANADEPPFSRSEGVVVSRDTGERSLSILKRLAETSLPEALNWNPIKLWEHMSQTDDVGYCPLGFGYSNYARNGYRQSLLKFGNVPSAGFGPIGAILGGAGLAISSKCKAKEVAVAYAQWVSGAECQRTVYFSARGQPGNRKAWTDAEVNREASNFFVDTLATLSQAFLRPRTENFAVFQAEASFIVSNFLKGKHTTLETLGLIDECYQKNCTAA